MSGIPSSRAMYSGLGAYRLRVWDPRVIFLFVILLGYVLWPVVQVLLESVWVRGEGISLRPWAQFIERRHWVYGLRSLGISIATVVLAGVFGTALAFFYFRLDFPGRGVLMGLTLLPFTLPPLVGVFAIWTLMGENGLFYKTTQAIFGHGFYFEKGYGGVLLVHTYSMYVYFFVLVGGALMAMDESQIEASRDLGASRWSTFTRVVLPQLHPALTGASILAFMTSMASFTAPFFYMAGKPVLTVGIQQAIEDSMEGLASADCVVLAVCAGVFLFLLARFEKTMKTSTRGAPRARRRIKSPWARWSLAIAATTLTLLLLMPHFSMIRESMVKRGTGFVGVPVEYTFANYAEIYQKAEIWRPIGNSLRASAAATACVILFTLLTSWLSERYEFAGKFAMRMLVMLPWALPGTVVAIGLLWITRSPSPLTMGMHLRATLTILALAYFIRLIPLAHRTITAGLARVPVELEGASRDLGASTFETFRRITIPLILPAVLAAATLTFVTAMGEFVSSILLQAPGTEPIAVKIDQLRRGPGGIQLASAYSVILLFLITLTFIIFGRRTQEAT